LLYRQISCQEDNNVYVRTLSEKYVNYSYSLVVPFPIHIFYPFPGAIKRTA
jgi:hypothetical protein